jgi:guanidinoacetate N-methyltransferase
MARTMTQASATGPIKDTVATRVEVGFSGRENWCAAPAVFSEDTLRIAGHPVMETWETSYMHRLASIATSGGGQILEVGYGMGISAAALLASPDLTSYTAVECHPDVAAQALEQLRAEIATSRATVLVGFWEQVTPTLRSESFDGILFDTYPMTVDEVHRNHFRFFPEAHRLLRPGGVLTYYSDEEAGFSAEHLSALHAAGFHDLSTEVCRIAPPPGCEYWRADTIVAPIVRKRRVAA